VIEILEPLANLPGVRLVGLVTPDGVPVAVPGIESRRGHAPAGAEAGAELDVDAVAAVATQWLAEVGRTVGALTWPEPQRVLLTTARGTLVLLQSPGSVLLAIVDAGVDRADLRLQMDGAAVRIGRALRSLGQRAALHRTPAALPQLPNDLADRNPQER
jgi:predicted regulator of Ras-like GTPase activity (Roadblock/LC7/MglB family)